MQVKPDGNGNTTWTRLTDAVFTHDATASAKVRLDYEEPKIDWEALEQL